jgi:hypothetical protein
MLEYSTIPISQLAKARSDRISLLIAFLFTCGKDAIEMIVGRKQAKKHWQ